MAEENERSNTLELATDLAIAWLSNPNTSASADDVPAFLQKVYSALNNLDSVPAAEEALTEPEFTGTGFPQHFYLRYDGYRSYFPLIAVGRLRNL